MRRWRTTKQERRTGVQTVLTEYKALSSIFIAEDLGARMLARGSPGLGLLGTRDGRPYLRETQAFHGHPFSEAFILFGAAF